MRVISGTARGLRLLSPEGQDTRPTLDNVKEAIFSMLFDRVRGAKVLDLFAGSGALGTEALSRGSDFCLFADKSRTALEVARTNVSKARLSDNAEFVCADFKKVLSDAAARGQCFDIVFLDPPYAEGFLNEALCLIRDYSLLTPDGVIVAEYDYGTNVDMQNYNLLKDKKYGRVCINILEAQ